MSLVAHVRGPAPAAVDALADVASAVELDGADVVGLFASDDAVRVRATAQDALDRHRITAPLSIRPAEMLDWGSVWKASLRAVRVGPLYLAPDGVDAVGARMLEVGPAFGSGGHPTTRLCLERIAERPPTGAVLDVGTGNGILALAALWLGASHATGTDTDAAALAVAARNAARHGLSDRLALATPLPDARFDRVLCNLHAAPIIDLAPELLRRLGPGGEATLSGFVGDQLARVSAAWKHVGARILGHDERDGWVRLDVAAPW
jgi:ribosomal protein L11 methyltransferase